MLDFVLYMVFSMMETYAMFFLAFNLFKIDIYPKEMVFAGFIMGFFSYVVRVNYQWVEPDIIIQYILIFCFFWLLFRIHLFYAAILTGMTYQAYTFIQIVYLMLFDKIGIISVHTFYGININAYLLQILSAASAVLIGYYIGHRRKGFDFIPDKPNGLIKVSNREKLLFILNLPTAIIVITILHVFNTRYFLAVPLLYGCLLYCYFYLSYAKDRSGNEYTEL